MTTAHEPASALDGYKCILQNRIAMRWSSQVSEEPDLAAAVADAARRCAADLGARPDLALLFVSEQHRDHYADAGELLAARLPDVRMLGCCASGVIGGGRELERRAAVSVVLAALPGVRLSIVHLSGSVLPAVDAPQETWARAVGVQSIEDPAFVLLADPFSFPTEAFVQALDRHYPGASKIGGLASGMRARGEVALYADGVAHRGGAVCLALSGNIAVDTYVAQGCRPIGEPMFVTRADGPKLMELDGSPALEVLQSVYGRLDARDQRLAQTSLFIGVAMRSARHEYAQGDFLIRNIMGAEEGTGALWIGADLHERHVVQFHLRDAATSAFDLDRVLTPLDHPDAGKHAAGALLFSCTGRGQYLYGEPGHDSAVFHRHAGAVPLGGFFCNGEIGPVQNSTYVHGYTSAFGLFRTRNR
jgi:small ligand-binding sensory domain FIST